MGGHIFVLREANEIRGKSDCGDVCLVCKNELFSWWSSERVEQDLEYIHTTIIGRSPAGCDSHWKDWRVMLGSEFINNKNRETFLSDQNKKKHFTLKYYFRLVSAATVPYSQGITSAGSTCLI